MKNIYEVLQQAREALEAAHRNHGVMLTSYPPQDAWVANGVAEKIRAAVKAIDCSTAGTAAPEKEVLVLLRMHSPQPNGNNVHVILRNPLLHGETVEERNEHNRYFYDEHTCPTNWMGVEVLIDGYDTDPHGLFEHVQTVVYPDTEVDLHNITADEVAELFSEFRPMVANK